MILPWIFAHPVETVGVIGVIGGLCFNGFQTWQNTRQLRIQNLSQAVTEHREIWSVFYEKPELRRILEIDLADDHVIPTLDEKLFLKSLFLHFGAMFRKQKLGMTFPENGLAADIRQFFAKPIPRGVWEEMEPFQEPDFVRYVGKNVE